MGRNFIPDIATIQTPPRSRYSRRFAAVAPGSAAPWRCGSRPFAGATRDPCWSHSAAGTGSPPDHRSSAPRDQAETRQAGVAGEAALPDHAVELSGERHQRAILGSLRAAAGRHGAPAKACTPHTATQIHSSQTMAVFMVLHRPTDLLEPGRSKCRGDLVGPAVVADALQGGLAPKTPTFERVLSRFLDVLFRRRRKRWLSNWRMRLPLLLLQQWDGEADNSHANNTVRKAWKAWLPPTIRSGTISIEAVEDAVLVCLRHRQTCGTAVK